MRVLVIGSGAREHALLLALARDPQVTGLVIAPGNAGTARVAEQHDVDVTSTDDVGQATTRLAEAGLTTAAEQNTTCCYAVQDKVWVTDPDGAPWEVYTVLADAPAEVATPGRVGDSACCGSVVATGQPPAAGCC